MFTARGIEFHCRHKVKSQKELARMPTRPQPIRATVSGRGDTRQPRSDSNAYRFRFKRKIGEMPR